MYGKVEKSKKVMKDDLIHYENNKKIIQKAVSNLKIIKSNDGYSYLELILLLEESINCENNCLTLDVQ